MLQIAIERAVIASYLLIDLTEDMLKDNSRSILDVDTFVLPLHKRIAQKINEALKANIPLPLLCEELSCKMADNRGNFKDEFLEILATMPLGNKYGLDWYIKKLISKKVERMLLHG